MLIAGLSEIKPERCCMYNEWCRVKHLTNFSARKISKPGKVSQPYLLITSFP